MAGTKEAVAIIGAGFAGLSAANTLINKYKFKNVTIYEAGDRIGGRAHTIEFGDGQVELGAQYLKGRGTPEYRLAQDHKLVAYSEIEKPSNKDNTTIILPSGNGISVDVLTAFFTELYPSMPNRLKQLLKPEELKPEKDTPILLPTLPTSMAEVFESEFKKWKEIWNTRYENVKPERKVDLGIDNLQSVLESLVQLDYGCPDLKQLGVEGYLKWKDFPKEEFIPLKQDGYSRLAQILADRLPTSAIRLNHPVVEIDWKRPENDKIWITFANQNTIVVDHVIVTCSIGHLKKFHQTLFTPPLPTEKRLALDGMGIGPVEKVIAEFDSIFWCERFTTFHFCWDSNEDYKNPLESLARIFRVVKRVPGRPQVLCAWIGDADSLQKFYKASDEEINDAMQYAYQKFFQADPSTVRPTTFVRTTWGSNPFFLGSYSYYTTGYDKHHEGPDQLAEPLYEECSQLPLVQFAGEATQAACYGTVHGAYWSGKREAKRLHKYYSKGCCSLVCSKSTS